LVLYVNLPDRSAVSFSLKDEFYVNVKKDYRWSEALLERLASLSKERAGCKIILCYRIQRMVCKGHYSQVKCHKNRLNSFLLLHSQGSDRAVANQSENWNN
jgi:hypothetical protein